MFCVFAIEPTLNFRQGLICNDVSFKSSMNLYVPQLPITVFCNPANLHAHNLYYQVEADLRQNAEYTMTDALLRHWRRFIDECKIHQRRLDEPVALGICHPGDSAPPCLIKMVRQPSLLRLHLPQCKDSI